MSKGKRTFMGFISTESKAFLGITTVQKKNLGEKKLELSKYDKVLRKHVKVKMKEVK